MKIMDGSNAAPPKAGWQFQEEIAPDPPHTVTASTIKVALCEQGAALGNCPGAGSDLAFTSANTMGTQTRPGRRPGEECRSEVSP